MDDGAIIDLFFSRSEQALRETSEKYGRYLHKIAGNILGNPEDTEECVNDSLYKAWNTIPPNRSKSLPVYLAMITREVSIDAYRRIHRKKRFGSEYPLPCKELSEVLTDGGNAEETVLDRLVLGNLLNRFLSGRPKENRRILVMRYFYMDSVRDIAE